MTITIDELTSDLQPEWDAFVQTSPAGLPLHLSGWQKVLQQTHGYETRFLTARQDGEIVGVMPLFIVRSVLLGNSASTMPGGLCAQSAEVAQSLIATGQEIAHNAGAQRLLLQDTRQTWSTDLVTTSHHVHWLLELSDTVGAHWKLLPSNVRRQVRIARRNDLRVVIDRSGTELDAFYRVFSRFTHQAGTPVFGRSFLENIIEVFPQGFNIVAVYDRNDHPIGAYFQLQMSHVIYGMWGAALRENLALRPVYLAYWEIVADAIEQGYHHLDMGRSPTDTSASKFKGQWGGESQPVYQQVAPVGVYQASTSVSASVQTDGRYQLFQRLWPKLPLAFASYLGPKLRRHMPFA